MAQRWKKAGSLTTGGMSLNVFTQDEMDAIHRATLEVLEHTGVLIGSPEARALLVEAGASVIDEDIVRFPQWMVADAVSCAPETLLLAGRTPDRDVVLDSTRVMFTNFGEAVYLIDPDTGEVRNTTKKDVEKLTRVVDALDVIPVCERMAGAQDYPEQVAELHNYEALLMNTTKHVFTGGGNGKLTQYMIDMAKAAVGEENFEERCPVTFNTCPISPLKLTADVCEVIMTAARNGATVNVLSMGMAGGSTPVNLAGALVVHNCEALAGLVLAQTTRRGAKFIYGSSSTAMDLRYGAAVVGTPELAVMDAEMAEMMLFSMDGIVVNDETLSVDVIKEVGPRSDFLAHMNTFENMYIQSKPKLIDRLTRDRWNEAGHLDMESRALIAAKELLATWEPEPLSEEACARVRAVLNAAERDYGVPESLE